MVKSVTLQRYTQPDWWNTIQNLETDLSICRYYIVVDSPMKRERLDHSINGRGKVSLTTAKARFLPHTLIIKKIPDRLKICL